MPKKTRKRFTAQEKVTILRLHLLEHTPVSDLCDQHGIHPTMFYRWQKEFFENATAAFESRPRRAGDDRDRRSPSWSRSSSASTRSFPNSWRSISN
jgi:transposase-like protein